MNIERLDTYQDSRFSKNALNQHGCFLVDDVPYEVEVISDSEAVIIGADKTVYGAVIDEFRFYAPHITRFYDKRRDVFKTFPPAELLKIKLEQIQPSQFYVDKDKIAAVSSFIQKPDDIIVQVLPYQDNYISLDGHTRLYYAVMKGWQSVRAVAATSDDWVYAFVDEAGRRNIHTPMDLILVEHEEYTEKWYRFCDDFFAKQS